MDPKSLKNQKLEKVEKRQVDELPSDCDSDDDSYWYSSTDSDGGYESPATDQEGDVLDPQTAGAVAVPKIPKEYRYRLTMWTAKTHYDVVKEVAKF